MSIQFADDDIITSEKKASVSRAGAGDSGRKLNVVVSGRLTEWQLRKKKIEAVLRWLVIGLLGPAALIVSVISAIHMVKWFGIGDSSTFANWTAGTFEFLAIAAMFTIIELSRLPKFVVFLIWTVLIGMVCLQINGNALHVFDYMQTHRDMVERAARFYGAQLGPGFERIIAFAIGAPLPIIAMFFIKILSSYWMLAFNRLKVKHSVK